MKSKNPAERKNVLVLVMAAWALLIIFYAPDAYAACDGEYTSGNFVISGIVNCTDETVNIDGNVSIEDGGMLTLSNAVFNFTSVVKEDGRNYFNVTTGGGLLITNGSVLMNNDSDFAWNFYIYNTSGSLIENSTINNTGYDTGGLGIDKEAGVALLGDCGWNEVIRNNTIINNRIGVYVEGSNCNVTNNTIESFDAAAFVSTDIIENATFSYNTINVSTSGGYGGILVLSNNSYVLGNVFYHYTAGEAIQLTSGDSARVENNTVIGNRSFDQTGIGFADGSLYPVPTNSTVLQNSIYNTSTGISVENNIGTNISGNTVYNSTIFGLSASNSNNLSIINNTLEGNVLDGISLSNSSYASIMDNTLNYNNGSGIQLDANSSFNIITENTLINNSQRGINSIGNSTENNVTDTFIEGYYEDADYYDVNIVSSNITFVNTTFNKSKVGIAETGSNLTVYWYLDINVTDNLTMIEGADVNIYDVNDNLHFSGLTNSSGRLARQTLQEYSQTLGSISYNTNYTLNASKANFNTTISGVNLTESMKVSILMNPNVSCGQTISGEISLNGDMNCNESSVIFGTDNILLDGRGFSIIGNGSGFGIDNALGVDNVTIINTRIINYSTGIYLNAIVENSTIFNNTIEFANISIDIDISKNINISSNTLLNSTSIGINLQRTNESFIIGNTVDNTTIEHGIRLTNSHHNAISNNEVSRTTDSAIGVYESSDVNISGNSITGGLNGISAGLSTSEVLVENNNITGNGVGIFVNLGSYNVSLFDNSIINSSINAIFLQNSSFNNTLQNNTLTDNENGIEIDDSDENAVITNTLLNNSYSIKLSNSSYASILSNTITNDSRDGITLIADSSYNTAYNNTIYGSSLTGFAINLDDSSGNNVSSNTVTDAVIGILMGSNTGANITSNTVNSSTYGVYAASSTSSIISFNTLFNSSNDGIFLNESQSNTIVWNTAYNSSLYGINAIDSDSNNISYNHVYNNTNNGIKMEETSDNNYIIGNNFTENSGRGIHITDSSHNILQWNDVLANSDGGIEAESSNNNTFEFNNISENTGSGLLITEGVNNSIFNNSLKGNDNSLVLVNSLRTTINDTNATAPSGFIDASFGRILYNDTVYYNESAYLYDIINISSNSIFVNSTAYRALNVSAEIRIDSISFKNATALIDAEDSGTVAVCREDTCTNISYDPGNSMLSFNSTGFTTYSADDVLECGSFLNQSWTLRYYDPVAADSCNGTSVNINTSNIIFDCSNLVLEGNNSSFGINISNANNVTIANCIIFNFSMGISDIDGENNYFVNNTVYSNNLYGIYGNSLNSSRLTNNTARNNTDTGIYLTGSLWNNLTNNTLRGNDVQGILLYEGSDNNTLWNNSAASTGSGIAVTVSSYNNITGNTFTGNTRGIYTSAGTNYTTIDGNTIYTSTTGIDITASSYNTLTDNTVNGSTTGIFIFSGSAYNTLTRNNASNAASIGIYLLTNADYSTLINNTGKGNDPDIRVQDSKWTTFVDSWKASYHLVNGSFIFENSSVAAIEFINTSMTATGTDLSADIIASSNNAFANSSNQAGFNTTANITLYGISFTDPGLQVQFSDDGDFDDCTEDICTELSYSGGTYLFNATRFSSFKTIETYSAPSSSSGGGGGDTTPPAQTCTNDCTSGSRTCSGNGYKTCGNHDDDSCLEWSAVTNCGTEEECSSGACVKKLCSESWSCTGWSDTANGCGLRTCTDSNSCGTSSSKPSTSKACPVIVDPPVADSPTLPPIIEQPSPFGPVDTGKKLPGYVTMPCINQTKVTSEKSIVKKDTFIGSSLVPDGYSLIIPPFDFSCNGDSLDVSLNIPANYKDVKVLRCRGESCYPSSVSEIERVECGGRVEEKAREEEFIEPEAFGVNISKIEKNIASENESIESSNYRITMLRSIGEQIGISIAAPQEKIRQPENRNLKIISTPIVVRVDKRADGTAVRLEMPFITDPEVEKNSISIYALMNNEWEFLSSLREDDRIIANIMHLEQYLDHSNEAKFALIGIVCKDCEHGRLENIYRPPAESGEAVIMIHGLGSTPATFNDIISDIRNTLQPWQAWAFSYPSDKSIAENAEELAQELEKHQERFESIYIAAHSLGAMITQKMLRYAYDEHEKYPSRYTFITKVKKAVLIGSPNEKAVGNELFINLFKFIVNQKRGGSIFNPNSQGITELLAGNNILRIPGVQYYVIAGTRPYDFNTRLFRITGEGLFGLEEKNDGIVTVSSAQHVGEGYINNTCENYWEINHTHTDLIDNAISRRIIEKIIAEEILKEKEAAIANNQYLQLAIDDCSSDDKYIVIGKEIRKEEAKDITGCSCGNGYCGVGETIYNCPSDCALIDADDYTFIIWLGILLLLLIAALSLGAYALLHRKRRFYAPVPYTPHGISAVPKLITPLSGRKQTTAEKLYGVSLQLVKVLSMLEHKKQRLAGLYAGRRQLKNSRLTMLMKDAAGKLKEGKRKEAIMVHNKAVELFETMGKETQERYYGDLMRIYRLLKGK